MGVSAITGPRVETEADECKEGDENLHRHVQTASTTAAHACQYYSALISSGQGQGSPVALNVGRWALTERR